MSPWAAWPDGPCSNRTRARVAPATRARPPATGVPARADRVRRVAAILGRDRAGSLLTRLAGGAIADRYSRRTVLITAPLVQAVLMGVVTVLARFGRFLAEQDI
ncbi:hypothetical protein Athai_56480 [Actinocatenispora thailandica]|uniref:Uncharacterized protein n=1 Tax=Actinocatenispora thailandica TaxID=227318 RepID=A0A7R7DUL7_9ACTN|nr:hypothetical protein Athai_56480 [Actinocatenispora thailandica]